MKNKISVIIPIYNEEDFIEACLESIYKSIDDDFNNVYEVILSDGKSSDQTLSILNKLKNKFNFTLLTNDKVKQVYALNQMIKHSSGDYIVRCDAHAIYPLGYFQKLVNYLVENKDVGNVAFRVETVSLGESSIEQAIAFCLGSKFGVGSSHRTHRTYLPEECDTVLFGAWKANVFNDVGLFDTSFIRGQDLEHNIRLKKAGLKVVQIPGEQIQYFSRNRISKLSKMMMQYSSVKPAIFKKHGMFPNLRSFVPLIFMSVLIFSFITNPSAGLIVLLTYFISALIVAFNSNKKQSLKVIMQIPFVFFLQHASHAYGWFVGIFKVITDKSDWESTR